VRERSHSENPWRLARVKSRRYQPFVAKEKWRGYENPHQACRSNVIDYFQPAPIVGALTTNTWGASRLSPARAAERAGSKVEGFAAGYTFGFRNFWLSK
jgi:hypothetical protein